MSYTTPRTWVDGQTVAASALNTDLRDNLIDHEARLAAIEFSGGRWTKTANQSVNDSSNTAVTFPAAEVYDEGGWGLTSNTTITVPAGAIPSGFTSIVVEIQTQVSFVANTTGRRIVTITKNGVSIAEDHEHDPGALTLVMGTGTDIDCVSGDTFQVLAYQESGGALNVDGSWLTIKRIGPF